jgi:hypothetical protein
MIEIIKNGELPIFTFTCNICGCEFKASADECKTVAVCKNINASAECPKCFSSCISMIIRECENNVESVEKKNTAKDNKDGNARKLI